MARKPRIHFPGAIYHVMLRGNNKGQIFFSNENRQYFYLLIEEGISRYGYRVHSFCLMDNHVHLALQVGDVSLSKIMQNLCFRYAQYINKQQDKIGHLFQGRFKAILLDDETYLLNLTRYIHLNPVESKIVNMADHYFWSSHRAYLGLVKIAWLTIDSVLSYFSYDRVLALSCYARFMQQGIEEDVQSKLILDKQSNSSVLGNDKFLNQLESADETMPTSQLILDYFVHAICLHYSVDLHRINEASRSHKHAKVRAIVAWLARKFNVCTLVEVAVYFKRDATGLTRSIGRLERSLLGREELIACGRLIESFKVSGLTP